MHDMVADKMIIIYAQLPKLCIELVHSLREESHVAKNPKGGIHHMCLAVNSNFLHP
jgi:hypothetical protein